MAVSACRYARFTVPTLSHLTSVNCATALPRFCTFYSCTALPNISNTSFPTSSHTSSRFLSSTSDSPNYNVNLTPNELNEIKSACHIVDVRQPEELIATGALPGARNIPLGELSAHIHHLPQDNVVFICQRGIRSISAIQLGNRPRHLEGGMDAWNQELKG